jgi:hypothetical protein
LELEMRVAVIYRPRNPPPVELLPRLLQEMTVWVDRYQGRAEAPYFFVDGGGMAVLDIDDSSELHRILVEHPFTGFMDVEILPVVDPGTAMQTLGQMWWAQPPEG